MNIKELEKKTKEEILDEARKQRKKAGIFLVILIVLVGYMAWGYIEGGLSTTEKFKKELTCQTQLETYFVNQTNQSISEFKRELCEESTMTRTINAFFDRFLQLDKAWVIKLLIFLGVVYLIQITFALVMDLVEVMMLVFVVIKRIYKWIKSKVSKKNESGK
jgi:hypothetical protein